MSNELVISFASSMDLAVAQASLAEDPVICFGTGSNTFKITISSPALISIAKGKQPVRPSPKQLLQQNAPILPPFQPSKMQSRNLPYQLPKNYSKQLQPTLKEISAQDYPFKREVIRKIFKDLQKRPDFLLPEPKVPEEVGKMNNPNYCPYHRRLGHIIEDCIQFKKWLRHHYETGTIMLSQDYLTKQSYTPVKILEGESSNLQRRGKDGHNGEMPLTLKQIPKPPKIGISILGKPEQQQYCPNHQQQQHMGRYFPPRRSQQ